MRRTTTIAMTTMLGLGLAACGSGGREDANCQAAASCVATRAGATPSAATATAHGWMVTATLAGASEVLVRVRVPGPLEVDGGCIGTLTAWAVGPGGSRVEGSPSPGARCNAIAVERIPEGQARDFTATVPVAAPGVYSIHGLLRTHLAIGAGARVSENLPVVSITVP